MCETPLDRFPPELSSPADQLQPQSFFAEMHGDSPVRWDETRGCWDVFGYEAVRSVASDDERFSVRMDANPDFEAEDADPLLLSRSMLHADPPRHDALRSVVDQEFTPDAVRELRPTIERRAAELLADASDDSSCSDAVATFDLVDEFAYPLTVDTICSVLGVPRTDREQVREWTRFATAAGDDEGSLPSLLEYFYDLVERRHGDSADDLTSAAAAADHLTQNERRDLFMVVLLGGLSTTFLIANTVWSLDEADAVAAVRARENGPERAVDETLRYRSPVQAHSRYVVERTVVGDATVQPGDKLCLWYAAANHDPAVFEDPTTFDLDRDHELHLAFGTGTHYCLGARLARLEATVALEAFLDHADDVSVDTGAMEPSGSMLLSGPSTMPVTLA